MTYNEFINQFPIYSTLEEARAKGYEGHHINPRSLQTVKEGEEGFDDRCVRLTPYEHIYAHYLLALENEDARYVFYNMLYFSFKKVSSIEKVTLEQLEQWARLREEGRKKAGEKISRIQNDSEWKLTVGKEKSRKISETCNDPEWKSTVGEETKRKISEIKSSITWKNTIGVECYKKVSKALLGHEVSEETKKKRLNTISDAAWKETTGFEANKKRSNTLMGHGVSEETRRKISEAKQNLSDEARRKMSEAHKGNRPSEETRKKLSEAHKNYIFSDEHKQHISEAKTGHIVSEETKKKISETKKLHPTRWFTDGVNSIKAELCPEGYHLGRTLVKYKTFSN